MLAARCTEDVGEYTEGITFSRRALFAGLMASTAVGPALAASVDPMDRVKAAADALAEAMHAAYGTTFAVEINYERGAVAIFRDFSKLSSTRST